MKLTENFNLSEFQCKCGCKMPEDVYSNIIKLANNLQALRNHLEQPIKLTNAYRCQKHNDSIKGSAKNSQHVQGKAADIKVQSMMPIEVKNVIEFLISEGNMLQGGIGLYNSFLHVDIRKNKARW